MLINDKYRKFYDKKLHLKICTRLSPAEQNLNFSMPLIYMPVESSIELQKMNNERRAKNE
jgi:hypothetical protein